MYRITIVSFLNYLVILISLCKCYIKENDFVCSSTIQKVLNITLMRKKKKKKKEKNNVRSGIRTHAYKSRLRPERSALDRSAILTSWDMLWKYV